MIVRERIEPATEGGWVLIKTYSDSGMMIQQAETGELYVEAIDPDFTNRAYTETEIPIEHDSEEDVLSKAEAYDILMGAQE
jgi:hypothetical protein